MVTQKRLAVFSPAGVWVALAAVAVLVLCTVALVWVATSHGNRPLTLSPTVKALPYGPADRNVTSEAAISRGAAADSERYAAQVPTSGAPSTQAIDPNEGSAPAPAGGDPYVPEPGI